MPDGSNPYIGKTPNWRDGYVPPAAEWNAWWALKLDASNPFVTQGPYLQLAGGTMLGRLVLNVLPLNPMDAVTKAYADAADSLLTTSKVAKAGDAMTGLLTLAADPVAPLQAVTKQYADSADALKVYRTGDVMTGPLTLAADPTLGLHAATKQYVDGFVQPGAPFLPLAGGTMTGFLTLNGTPVAPLQAATKGYVDAAVTTIYTLRGGWNASTNSPVLSNGGGGGVKGDVYTVSTAGSTSLDGQSTWAVGDQVQHTGAAWVRVAYSTSFGSMAFQQASAVAITGGQAIGLTQVALSNSDSWSAPIGPDMAWSVRDANGNIVIILDYTGLLTVSSLTAANLALTGPLNAASVIATSGTFTTLTATTATMGGDVRAAAPVMPDLVGGIEQDSSGNIVKGYTKDGVMQVVGVNAQSLSVNNVPINVTPSVVPNDAIDVRAAAYGAKGGAAESYAYATTSGGTLTLINYNGTLSLLQIDASTALLTLSGATRWSGWAPQPSDVGKTLYLTAGAYMLTATVAKYLDGQNLWLNAAGITTQTGVVGTVTLPAFSAADIGKSLIIDGMGQDAWWSGTYNVRGPDTITPYGQQTYINTITTVVAPNQITITGSFPFAWTSVPTRLMWGVNDGDAAARAAIDCLTQGKRKIWFSGDGNLYLLLGLVASGPAWVSYTPTIASDATALLNGVLWGADNARVFACNGGVLSFRHRAYQPNAVASRDAPRLTHGRLSMPRCAQLTTINVCITGDSLGTFNPQSQASSVMNTARFMQEFRQQNPGKVINFYNISIGGKTFADLTNPAFVLTDVSGFADAWNIPRPIVGTIKYIDLFANLNRTATSATNPIVPDLVVILECGANDAWAMDGASIQAMINLIRRATHSDGFGPTDVIMQTDHHALVTKTWSNGIAGGVALAAVHDRSWYQEYSVGLIRSTALNKGFGCIDLEPLMDRACFGFDPTRRTMRQVPSWTLNATAATPVAWPVQCRDFSAWLATPAAANDAAAWTTLGQLDITISQHQGNRLMLRMGTNGNLWLGVSVYGGTTPTVTTLIAGSKTITFAPPTSFPGVIMQMSEEVRQLYLMSGTGIFTVGMNGQSLVAPVGALRSGVYQPQRTYIRQVMDTNNAMLYDCNASNTSFNNITATITIGGQQFISQDGTAMTDIVVFYPDGTVFNTQVDWNGAISATQAMMVDAAPQALAGVSVPVFLGRMAIRWYDTGLKPSATTVGGVIELSINRGDLMFGYAPDMTKSSSIVPMVINRPIERFGGPFNPVFRAQGTQSIQLSNLWVDAAMPFVPSCTPWELRGIGDTNSDYAAGGVGGHYGSRVRPEVLDPFYATQNFSTG